MQLLQPDGWARPKGYSNGVSARGRAVFVAGQVGWNPRTGQIETDDFVGQVRQTLENIVTVLEAGGATPQDVVRLTWFVTDRKAYLASQGEIGKAYRNSFGKHFPPMSVVVVAGLLEEGAKVEIEATAVVED